MRRKNSLTENCKIYWTQEMNKVKIEITYEYVGTKQREKAEDMVEQLQVEARTRARTWNLQDSIKISYVKDHMAV